MPLLSNLLRFHVVDAEMRTARLDDLVIDLNANTYPPVTYLLYRLPLPGSLGQNETRLLNWKNVSAIDRRAKAIRVDELEQGRLPEQDWLEKAILLKRDILDALMLDLHERAPVLSNDLWLEEQQPGQLVLRAVDISFRAVIRRLTGGFLFYSRERPKGSELVRAQHDWKYIEFLRGDPQAVQAGLAYHGLIARLPHGELAYLADLLPYRYSAELLALLPDSTAADTLEMMVPARQLQAFKELDRAKALRLLTLMRPDVVADLIARLKPIQARYWLEHLPRMQADRIIDLLHYPADSAGGIMTNDFITVTADLTVKEAITQLVEQLKLPDFINFIQFVYIVDNDERQRLQGSLSLRDLLVADAARPVSEVMDPYLIAMDPLDKATNAARKVVESGMTALPVVDPNGKLLGIITIDTAMSLILPASSDTREILRLYS